MQKMRQSNPFKGRIRLSLASAGIITDCALRIIGFNIIN
jgi:hypothetical protein